MSSYIAGGSTPETAAHFTRGELEAIYKGNHHSRDSAGQWRTTLPPEALHIVPAMKKADAAIAEIIRYCHEMTRKGQLLNGKIEKTKTHEAPEAKEILDYKTTESNCYKVAKNKRAVLEALQEMETS